jgi:hypothetical protein
MSLFLEGRYPETRTKGTFLLGIRFRERKMAIYQRDATPTERVLHAWKSSSNWQTVKDSLVPNASDHASWR